MLPGVLNYDSFKVTITQLASAQGGLAFTFKTPQLRLSADDWYIQSQRDNSIPYFTDEYINYLKYGKKADEMQYAFSAAQAVVQGVGTGISTGFTIAALSQSAGPVAGVLGAAVGASTAAISLAASMAQQGEKNAENQRKMQESGARNSTANDVSIFSSLNQQALRRRTFQPVTGITAVRDYFHLFGYATDEYYSIDLTRQAGRYWFDYLQCTPV